MPKPQVIIAFLMILFLSCKKEELPPKTEPAPSKTGTLNIKALVYDSIGDLQSDKSGVKVTLYNSAFSATTDTGGMVVFNGVTYGTQLPVLLKDGYEGAPLSVDMNSSSATVSVPCARQSTFKILNLTGQVVHKDSITLSFNLDKIIPPNKQCKIAVLTSTSSALSPSNYESADIIPISSSNVSKLNIALLPHLRASVDLMATNLVFYISAVPCSYGIYESNVYPKPVLLGKNLNFPGILTFTKNWN